MNKKDVYALVDRFYRDHFNQLCKSYNRFLNNYPVTEEAVQEAFTRALTYWDSCPSKEAFEPWFRTIVGNAIKDAKREESKQGMTTGDESVFDIPINAAAIPSIIQKEVNDLIGTKDEPTARILRLSLFHQYRPVDIEKVVGEKVNNIRQIVHRFRNELKDHFQT